nr:RNA-directed DNA polymerase, eukaryota, reverse transcriptase zinc-binding domain protein [Tanacetum cinerariifolium]
MPILLAPLSVDFGLITFNFFNSWLLDKNLQTTINKFWDNFAPENCTNPIVSFKNKMKALKTVIKDWSSNRKDAQTREKEDLIKKINNFDANIATRYADLSVDVQRSSWIDNLRNIDLKENLDSSQKAKIKWSIEAGENSKFFHAIVNQKRSPTREFNIHRGLRQGDPLSPFLFIIAMEGLHVAMEDVMAAGIYKGFNINTLNLSHLFFADDALFIGLPIDCNMALVKNWNPIVDKFSKRLSNWKASLLSIGGGLGIGSLFSLNHALIQKWRWRFINNPHALWSRLIVAIHGSNKDTSSFFSHVKSKGVWSIIVGSINIMHEKGFIPHSSIQRRVNNGASTKFWHDTWAGISSFKHQFPRLFRLAMNRDCLVRDCWNNGWRFEWTRNVSSGSNASQLASLHNTLYAISLNDSEDVWVWSIGTPFFTVKSARCQIDNGFLPDGGLETRWNRFLPKKINIFIWRTLRDRLPSRWNLSRKEPCLQLAGSSTSLYLQYSWLIRLARGPAFVVYKKSILEVICGVVLWSLWNFRNEMIFGTAHPKRILILDKIVDCSFR